ncbi:MAG: chromosome segregation protein SMC [Firmicutes bacterium]|nr:chromosome segregation protein SMC [Bacillota bacterium]
MGGVARIEVAGFKSFADRLELPLLPGVTAVVGPNGTGKSNLVDAVRWALGEQRPRALRAERMEDLLFAGSERRRPAGAAECALTLDNADDRLGVGTAEVEVRRRLYRSGDAAYFLNRRPVRLRDLEAVLAAAGLGSDGYAIVSQGRVDEVLRARAADRMRMVEEAAGVAALEGERRRALSALDEGAVERARLESRRQEAAARVAEWAEQAERARQDRRLGERVRQLELALAERERQRLARWAQTLAAEAERWRAAAADAGERARQVASQAEALGALAARAGERAARWRDAAEAARERARREGERWHRERVRREESARRRGEAEAALAAAEERAARARAEASAWAERLPVLAAEAEAWAARAERARRDQAGARAMAAADRAEALGAAAQEAAARHASAEEAAARAERAAAAAKEAAAAAGRRVAEAQARERAAAAAARTAEEAWRRARERWLEARAAASAAAGGGRPAAVEWLMRAAADGELEGIVGPLGELVRPQPGLEVAIDAALGGSVSDLVVARAADAEAAVAWLRRRGGRATFLPLDTVVARPSPSPPALPGVIGVAADLVDYPPEVRAAVLHRLGGVWVVETLPVALAAARRTGMRQRVVTRAGDVVAPGGAITGGAPRLRRETAGGGRVEALASAHEEAERAYVRARAAWEEAVAALEGARVEASGRERDAVQRQAEAAAAGREREAAARAEEAARRAQAEAEAEARRWRLEAAGAGAEELEPGVPGEGGDPEALAREAASRLGEARGARAAADRQAAAAEAEAAELRQRLAAMAAEGEEGEASEAAASQAEAQARRVAAWAARAERLARALTAAAALARTAAEGARGEAAALAERSDGRRREAEAANRQWEEATARLRSAFGPGAEADAARAWAEVGGSDAEVERELAEVRQARGALGPVWAGAEAAHAEASERLRGLEEEIADLEEGRRALLRLAEEARRRLERSVEEALERVRSAFARLVGELLGGRGELAVAEEGEGRRGLEVRIALPGKRRTALDAMSGGERALGALAFLFALLEVRPAALVVLDEVEAALDPANAARFAHYLRRAGEGQQFLVVTHQRATMEVAHALWGFTAQEAGVSHLVTVRLDGGAGEVAG